MATAFKRSMETIIIFFLNFQKKKKEKFMCLKSKKKTKNSIKCMSHPKKLLMPSVVNDRIKQQY